LSIGVEVFFDNGGKLFETAAFSHFGAIRRIKVNDPGAHIPECLRLRIKPDYFSSAAGYGFRGSGSFNRIGMLQRKPFGTGFSRKPNQPILKKLLWRSFFRMCLFY
jgi:hypothetical protein